MKFNLAEIIEVIGGGTPSTKNRDYWNGDIPWLSVKDFNNDLRYVRSTEKHITEKGLKNSSTVLLQPDDTIISARGTVGELAMIPIPMAFNQSCYGLRAKTSILDATYLYYLMKNCVVVLKKNAHGSVFDTITMSTFSSIEVVLPSMSVQRKIAGVLASLDDKIELNNQINGNLLEQAKTLFDSCYENAANKSVIFTDCIDVLSGGTPSTSNPKYWNGHIPFFSPKDVGKPYTFLTEKYISEEGLSNCNSKLYPAGTTFITARGTVGKVSLAGCPMAINQSCYALSSSVLDPSLVYFYTLKTVESLKHKASGAVFDAITVKDFKTERIRKINATKSADLVLLINPIMDEIHYRTIESLKLTGLRDTLLPKLMSGEIDISDIDL